MRSGSPAVCRSLAATGLSLIVLQTFAVPGCTGPRGGSATVKITFFQAGFSPRGTDKRYLKTSCGRCGAALTGRIEKCPSCGVKARWPETVECEFCCAPDKLKVEGIEDRQGFCAFCSGTGKDPNYRPSLDRLPFGMSRTRRGRGSGRMCPVCKGSGGCNWCRMRGRLTVPDGCGE